MGYDLDDPSTWGDDGDGGGNGAVAGLFKRRRKKADAKKPAPKFCWRAAVAEHSCDCMTGCKLPPSQR